MDTKESLPFGMTVKPMGYPLMMDAFLGAAIFAIGQKEAVEAFEKETNLNISGLAMRSGLEKMIDQSTGRESEALSKWLDWVALNVFGTDENADE